MPDSFDSYCSKFVKLEWMVGRGYRDPKVLSDESHIFYHYSAKDFDFIQKVKIVKDDEDFTIQ